MPSTSINVFSSTIQKSNAWVHDLMDEMQWDEPHRAYHGLRAVLHALRDRLSVNETSDLAAQLPLLIRGMYYEGWQPAHTPVRDRTPEQFFKHIFDAFPNDLSVNPEKLVRAVFMLLSSHISHGELEDVKANLPPAIRELWPVF